ncbi:MAG: hypothetical protein LBB79_09565 [Prevotellaceae bacterium]|jgi:hypothetical protein|nr:hypothetical protein [Prevotellaceae bacterium]
MEQFYNILTIFLVASGVVIISLFVIRWREYQDKKREQKKNVKSKKEQHLQFSLVCTSDNRKRVYDLLISNAYLPKDTDETFFNWVFGAATRPQNFDQYLDFQGNKEGLCNMVNAFFPDNGARKWVIAAHCFLVQGEHVTNGQLGKVRCKNSETKNFFKTLKSSIRPQS